MHRIGHSLLDRGTGYCNSESELITCKVGPLAFSKNVVQKYTQKFHYFSKKSCWKKEQIGGKNILRAREMGLGGGRENDWACMHKKERERRKFISQNRSNTILKKMDWKKQKQKQISKWNFRTSRMKKILKASKLARREWESDWHQHIGCWWENHFKENSLYSWSASFKSQKKVKPFLVVQGFGLFVTHLIGKHYHLLRK